MAIDSKRWRVAWRFVKRPAEMGSEEVTLGLAGRLSDSQVESALRLLLQADTLTDPDDRFNMMLGRKRDGGELFPCEWNWNRTACSIGMGGLPEFAARKGYVRLLAGKVEFKADPVPPRPTLS